MIHKAFIMMYFIVQAVLSFLFIQGGTTKMLRDGTKKHGTRWKGWVNAV
jgi:hypothetical protein